MSTIVFCITVPSALQRRCAKRDTSASPQFSSSFLHDRLELQCPGIALIGETKHVFRLLPCGSMELGWHSHAYMSVQSGVHTYRLVPDRSTSACIEWDMQLLERFRAETSWGMVGQNPGRSLPLTPIGPDTRLQNQCLTQLNHLSRRSS
jgi:hypothetical protein